MDIVLAWMTTTVIFGTLVALGCVAAHFVHLDWQRAYVSKRQIIIALRWWVVPVHVIFTCATTIGWLQRPAWWPPHGPDVASLTIPSVAIGIADAILAAVLICVWPSRVSSKL